VLAREWAGQSSEDHRATVLLRDEHALLIDLLSRQHDPAITAGDAREPLEVQILDTVDLLGRVEREAFFPALPPQYHALARAFAAHHEGMAACVAALRRQTTSRARLAAHGERLELLARENVAAEQALLYTALERDYPDLNHALWDVLVAARGRWCAQAHASAA